MAFLVQTRANDGATLYVYRVHRRHKDVTWTPHREKARRFRTESAAENAAELAARAVTSFPPIVVTFE